MKPVKLAAAYSTANPRMKFLILGAGQVGSTAAYHLAREEANEVTIVDSNPAVLRDLQDAE